MVGTAKIVIATGVMIDAIGMAVIDSTVMTIMIDVGDTMIIVIIMIDTEIVTIIIMMMIAIGTKDLMIVTMLVIDVVFMKTTQSMVTGVTVRKNVVTGLLKEIPRTLVVMIEIIITTKETSETKEQRRCRVVARDKCAVEALAQLV